MMITSLISRQADSDDVDMSDSDGPADDDDWLLPEYESENDDNNNESQSDNENNNEAEYDNDAEVADDETVQPRRGLRCPETDDEPDDDEALRQSRRDNKDDMLGVIADRLNGPVLFRSNLYTPDEEDQKFFARHIIRPLLENSQLWRKFGPKASAEAKRMVFAGEMPTRKSKVQQAIFSSTPFHYMSALKAFLGLLQDDLIANGLENRLVEGQLKI